MMVFYFHDGMSYTPAFYSITHENMTMASCVVTGGLYATNWLFCTNPKSPCGGYYDMVTGLGRQFIKPPIQQHAPILI